MKIRKCLPVCALLVLILSVCPSFASEFSEQALKQVDIDRGIIAVVGLPEGGSQSVIDLAKTEGITVYFQTDGNSQATELRRAAEAAGLLGRSLFVDIGSLKKIHLSDNVADGVLVSKSVTGKVSEAELLRVLRPKASAFIASRKLTKPVPVGIDEWTHPYHGPDNNPQSTDKYVRGDFRTQFLAEPKFSPMPEQSVAAGGRIYKAMGHIAHKENQNKWLNQLLCINAYNGTILWQRELPKGFMIHRNTMVATDDALLLGDDKSCKIIDGRTGEIRDELKVSSKISDGPVWKWMALHDGVLIALVGNEEEKVDTKKSNRRGLGHWPWSMWKGHDYKNPKTAFGFGRTLVAYDLKTKKLIWDYRDKQFLDARAIAMSDGKLYFYSPEKFLGSLDAATGSLLWKNNDKDLLEAIGPNGKAQHYVTGYATTCYMKSNDKLLFFSGPQRERLVVASAEDGKLAWTHETGNLQLVLRDDAVYAAGPQKTLGVKLDYSSGSVIEEFPARRACTRATGSVDSIFFRASGGTVRVLTETNTAQHISPMRPPCQDGVLISNGHLYWGPWMCGCQLSLYGNIALAPVGKNVIDQKTLYQNALLTGKNIQKVEPLPIAAGDWPSYRGNNARSNNTAVAIPKGVKLKWQAEVTSTELPTAPVVAGGYTFIADRTGTVKAFDESGQLAWTQYTAGPVYYPPAVENNRVYVGSADGRVYSYEAKTGRFLWSFQVAPQIRLIPVFGKLISTWPVAGGVVVENGTVYAAAGIAHYDGTYIVALDATSGKLKAKNTTSGVLSPEVNSGISMQGNLMIQEGELRFLAGGVYETSRYNLETLKCLNTPKVQVTSQFRTAFYPYYPAYGKYVSLEHTFKDGQTLSHDASYEGSVFSNLALQSAMPPGVPRNKKEASRWYQRRGQNQKAPKNIWQDKTNRRFTSFVVSENQVLATGHPDAQPQQTFLAAIDVKQGADIWLHKLPAEAVKGGTAIDSQGQIYVALENGQLLCYEPIGK